MIPLHAPVRSLTPRHAARWRRRVAGGLGLLLPALLSCTEKGLIKPFLPDAVQVEAPRETLRPAEVMVLRARLTSTDVSITTEKVSWSSTNPAVATVDSSGLVTAVSRGQTVLGATVLTKDNRSLRGTTTLTVVGVQAVNIEGAPASLVMGTNAQLTARLILDAGAVTVPVTWSSSDPTKVTVSGSGVITGVAIGSATITATAEGKSGTALVRVISNVAQIRTVPGTVTMVAQQTLQFSAVLTDAAGNVLTGQTVGWSSTSPTVASITATGLVTAVAPGVATITATEVSTGRTATAVITVLPRVATSTISPSNPSFFQGQSLQLNVAFFDAGGTSLMGRPTIWQSASPNIASIGRSSGLVTGVAPGTATIVAIDSLSGYAANTSVTVVAPVASVVVSPPTTTLAIAASQQFTASAFDVNGGPLSGRPVTWSSSNASVATVSSLGLVTAVAPGTATISATVESKTASGTVTVSPPPVASVRLSPTSASLVVGAAQPFTAAALGTDGAILQGRTVTWSSTNASVATVNSSGLVTGVAQGTATIIASIEGRTATAAITVTAPPVNSVVVAPATATVITGGTRQFTATLRDAAGLLLPGREVSWSSSSPAIATISTDGLLTAVAVGTVTITATSEGKSGTAAVTVSNPPVASVTVTPPTASLLPTERVTLRALAFDASGEALTGRPVTWSVANPAVATINATGLVTAVAPGTTTATATVEGRTGTAAITVNAPVATVTVVPATLSMIVGASQQLSATSRDSAGNQLQRRPVEWSSGAPSVATVSAQGLVSAVAPGSATITATVEGRSATARVTVALSPVTSITLDPDGGYLPIGIALPIRTTLRDASGGEIADRRVSWSSSDVTRGTVNADGEVSALTTAPFTVTATSDGRTATAVFEGRPPLRSGQEQVVTNSVAGSWSYFAIHVPAGTGTFTVAMSGGTGDPDLYVWRPGNTGTANCFPELDGPVERCEFLGRNAVVGVWLVGIRAYTPYAQTRLLATVRP